MCDWDRLRLIGSARCALDTDTCGLHEIRLDLDSDGMTLSVICASVQSWRM